MNFLSKLFTLSVNKTTVYDKVFEILSKKKLEKKDISVLVHFVETKKLIDINKNRIVLSDRYVKTIYKKKK